MPTKGFRTFVSHIDKDFPTIDEFVKNKHRPREDRRQDKTPKARPPRNTTSMNRNEGSIRLNELEMKQANAQLAQEREE